LGGSSAINIMMCTYPSRQDIDDWQALNNLGWSFDDFAVYYKKFETSKRTDSFYHSNNAFDPAFHDGNGPIQASFPNAERVGDREWLEAFEARGLRATNDPKAGDLNGGYR
jgi:choline dehydrogenase-like flavoprotein